MMIDFDCLDGIESSINFGNSTPERQVGQSSTSKESDNSGEQLRQPTSHSSLITSENIAQQHRQAARHEQDNEYEKKTNQSLTDISLPTTHSTSSSSYSYSYSSGPGVTTKANCYLDQNKDIISMASMPAPQAIKSRSRATWTGDDNLLSCLLITANVGTIFEESTLLELWFQQLRDYLIKIRPRLVAIHCQEVGGKNYESSMKNVSNFTDKILGDKEIVGEYSRVRIFLDDNFDCLEQFTALGCLYLIHDSVKAVRLYNFKTAQYDSIQDRLIFRDNHNDCSKDIKTTSATNNIISEQEENNSTRENENNNNNIDDEKVLPQYLPNGKRKFTGACEHVEKIKFPHELFPECRSSRKGFMRTRWLFNDVQLLDLVNIHLFHDASNLIAMEKTPSPYAQNRQRALDYALRYISAPLKGQIQIEVPLFIFGDFNFRLDTNKVIQKITDGVSPIIKRNQDNNEVEEFVYHRKISSLAELDTGLLVKNHEGSTSNIVDCNSRVKDENSCNDSVVMTIGKKLFDCENLDEMFRATKNTEWLQELDNELNSFKDRLFEFKISFSPSYPFKEDKSGGHSYMKTRCPAWCDRILFNRAGKQLIFSRNQEAKDCQDSERKIELLQNQGDVIYRLMGNSVPMGDHKPVLLYCKLELLADRDPSIKSLTNQKDEIYASYKESKTNERECNLVETSSGRGNLVPTLEDKNDKTPNISLIESTYM